ncbi:hypothetical protein HMPREF8571_0433 [Streptococcus mitis ATCC 6249]|uniref:Uncharacterized protein n=2 Tax=Streptococcus mitis TaxID=28037 RepID=E0PPG6_STRMT|nr:hypothetical protein HMPREF8571_0433 [Streptococcus mitis ATCC 6249]
MLTPSFLFVKLENIKVPTGRFSKKGINMKKSILEKTIDSIEKQNQRVRHQQIRHHETIQKQIKLQKKRFDRLSQGESGIRHSRLGVKCGYATITGGLITTLFSPWNGLGIMTIGGITVLSNLYHIKRIEAKLKK